MLHLGIIRETKDPPDRRVPLTPLQCRRLLDSHPDMDITVQPSGIRCFADREFGEEGIRLSADLSHCGVLLGVKEVRIGHLLPEKTYLFFSHTAKKQPYNRVLLQEIIRKGIRLIDYEYLTAGKGQRVVAFGRWAGIVGAYNGLRAFGLREKRFELKPAFQCGGYSTLRQELNKVDITGTRTVLTGGGRVARGAAEVLDMAGARRVEPGSYPGDTSREAVYTRLDPWHYTRRRDGRPFEFTHFMSHPEAYENAFLPYAARSDLFIACHYWDPRSPILLSSADLSPGGVPVRVIADISCDIDGPIASTLRPSTIQEPFYGYDRKTGRETLPFGEGAVTVMAVDNLPGELPRDASTDFGEALMEHVIPELAGERDTGMLKGACIADGGVLTAPFAYLQDYLAGRE